jgi:signal transduction histidine kinase
MTTSSVVRFRGAVRGDGRTVRLATTSAALLGLLTLAFASATPLRFAVFAPELDIAAHTLGSLVCAAVAALSYGRLRQDGAFENLLQASAFVVFALANLANTAVILLDIDRHIGLRIGDPGQFPLYAWGAAQLISAALLAAGGIGAIARARVAPTSLPVLWLPTVALVALWVLLWLGREQLPVLVDPFTLRQLADEAFSATPLPAVSAGVVVLDGAAGALLLVGALGYAVTARSTGGIPRTYLVVGLVTAAFSQLHVILFPAVYSGLFSTADSLRLAFYLILVAGIYAGTSADVRALRVANSRLELLAAAEADRVAIAERARLARELHDGLAQHLWTAKLEFDRFAADLPESGTEPHTRRVQAAIDAAIIEARDAVETLRAGFDAGLSFADELPRRLDVFVDRTGYPVDLELDPTAGRLPGVVAAELLRIVEEALHNIQKHADATRIRVRVTPAEGGLAVSIEDNGRGFNVHRPQAGHGLPGMRERAALLGGRLDVRSAPGDGTAVTVRLPSDIVMA